MMRTRGSGGVEANVGAGVVLEAPTQTPEIPTPNQGRKKAKTVPATTVTATTIDKEAAALITGPVTPTRSFFDTSDCNAVTSKRLGGRTVLFSPTIVGAIAAHAGFALDSDEHDTFALLAQVLFRSLKSSKPNDATMADHFGVSFNIVGSKHQSKVIGKGNVKLDLIVYDKGYLVVTPTVQKGDYNLTKLLTELEQFYSLGEEEEDIVEMVNFIPSAPTHATSVLSSDVPIQPYTAPKPTVPTPTPSLSSMVAPSVPFDQLQQFFSLFQNVQSVQSNQSQQRTMNMVAKTQPRFSTSLPGFAAFKQDVMQFGLYPGCLFDFLTPNDRTTLALTFSEMNANQAIPYVEELLKAADAANSLKLIEEQLHRASFSVALNGLKIKVGDSPKGGPDEIAWRQAMVTALASCTGLSNHAKNTVIMATVEEDYKSTISHWKAMNSETWKHMNSLDLVSQLSQQLAIVRNAASMLQGDKKLFLKPSGNARNTPSGTNNNDNSNGFNNNNTNTSGINNNNNSNTYSNTNSNGNGRFGQGANGGFRGRGIHGYNNGLNNTNFSKVGGAPTVNFADAVEEVNADGEEETATLKSAPSKKRVFENTKPKSLVEIPTPLTDEWCLTNNYCKICRCVGHYYFACKAFDVTKCAKSQERRDEIGREYDTWKASQSAPSSKKKK